MALYSSPDRCSRLLAAIIEGPSGRAPEILAIRDAEATAREAGEVEEAQASGKNARAERKPPRILRDGVMPLANIGAMVNGKGRALSGQGRDGVGRSIRNRLGCQPRRELEESQETDHRSQRLRQ